MLDALIIGAGPAGLTAATYLGRYRRKTLLLDSNLSRARWIPESHNTPGFSHGISGNALLREMRTQALRYGPELRAGKAESIEQVANGFRVHVGDESLLSRYVVLATGIIDHLPAVPGAEAAVQRSLLRLCPICDAFEAIEKRIAVVGVGEHAEREARFLRSYSDKIALVHISPVQDEGMPARLERAGIELIETKADRLEIRSDHLQVHLATGEVRAFEVFYAALGCVPQTDLAVRLGARVEASGGLEVDAHQQTSVTGLYAAGDVVRGLSQIVVAAAEAAIAATHIHNRLRAL